MRAEETINLLDVCWFELNILQKKSSLFTSGTNLDQQKEEKPSELYISISELSGRSLSDQTNSTYSFSPVSVLSRATLQTIHSGKEVNEHEDEGNRHPKSQTPRRKVKVIKRKRRSKSLSELEFEELKGFMDLGFVFSKEEKDPDLVSIVPGLQRLGKEEENVTFEDEPAVSRPYLSEAWETMFEIKPLINLRVPSFSNEIDVKDSIRWWAHTVASAVR